MTTRAEFVDDGAPPSPASDPAASESAATVAAADAPHAVFAAILAAAIVVAIAGPMCFALNIWIDEAFTLHTTAAGPVFAWLQAIKFEGQAPLYFCIESIWRLGNERSIGFARLPSVAFAALAAATIVGAARRMAPRIPSVAVALATALNPIVLWYASELRLYALLLFIGAVLCWTYYEGFLRPHTSQRARIGYVVCAIAGLYTQYYIGFVLAAQLLAIIVLRRAALRNYALSIAVVAVAFAPYAHIPIGQVGDSGDFVNHLPLLGAVHQLFIAIFIFLLPHDAHWTGPGKYAGYAGAAAVTLLVLAAGQPRPPRDPALRAVVVSWLLTLVFLVAIFAVSGTPFDISRHVIFLMPPSVLIALLVLAAVTRWRPVIYAGALIASIVFTSAGLWYRYHPPLGKPGDWQRVAQTIAADDEGTPVAVYTAENELALQQYLPGPLVAVPRPIPFNLGYVQAMKVHNDAEVAQVLDPLRARAARLWFVESQVGDQACCATYVYAYLDRYYRLERDAAFNGASASLYVRR